MTFTQNELETGHNNYKIESRKLIGRKSDVLNSRIVNARWKQTIDFWTSSCLTTTLVKELVKLPTFPIRWKGKKIYFTTPSIKPRGTWLWIEWSRKETYLTKLVAVDAVRHIITLNPAMTLLYFYLDGIHKVYTLRVCSLSAVSNLLEDQ